MTAGDGMVATLISVTAEIVFEWEAPYPRDTAEVNLHMEFCSKDGVPALDISIDEKSLTNWGEIFELITPSAIQELANYMEWLLERKYFADACLQLDQDVRAHPPFAHTEKGEV